MTPSMLAATLCLFLSQTPVPSFAMPGLNAVGLEKGAAALYAELFAQEMQKRGARVLSARDIEAVVGLEREKQLLGCADKTSCIAELAGALGVQGVVIGDLGHIGSEYALNLKVVSPVNGEPLALFNARSSVAEQVPRLLNEAAWALTSQLKARGFSSLSPGEPTHKPSTERLWALVPGAIGVAGLTLGVIMQVQAGARFTELQTAPSLLSATTAKETGKSQELLGNIALSIGVAGAIAAAMMVLLPDSVVSPVAWMTPSTQGFGLSGVWP